MVTAMTTEASVPFNGHLTRVKLTIDLKNLRDSTAKISRLSIPIEFPKETIDWNISKNIPLKKVPELIRNNFFYIKIQVNGGLHRLRIERNIKLQTLETFNTFLDALQQEASRHHLYPILSQMITAYESSDLNRKNRRQLQKILPFLTAEDQCRLKTLQIPDDEEKYKDELKDELSDNSLYAQAVQSAFPEVIAMHRQLKELNAALKSDVPYLVPLDGEIPGNPPEKPLSKLLTKVLRSSKQIVVIGEAGSGKSLFLMAYVRNLLRTYSLGDPIPFYIDLSKIKNPNAILVEYLKQYNLDEQHLKKLNTRFFFDGYDELIGQDRDNLFNIFTTNQLHLWKAKFVFSCRDIFNAFELEDYFAPPNGSTVQQVDICSLDTSKINLFFRKYTSTHSTGWSSERYWEDVNRLGLNELIKRPLHLRCAADHLPSLIPNFFKEDRKELFFWGIWVCRVIWREFDKINANTTKKPVDYLNYILEVAHLMQLCGVRALSTVSETRVSISVEHYIQEYSKSIIKFKKEKEMILCESENYPPDQLESKITAIDEKIKHQQSLIEQVKKAPQRLQVLLYDTSSAPWQSKALLVNRSNRVQFVYPHLRDYLAEISQDPESKSLLIQQLDSLK